MAEKSSGLDRSNVQSESFTSNSRLKMGSAFLTRQSKERDENVHRSAYLVGENLLEDDQLMAALKELDIEIKISNMTMENACLLSPEEMEGCFIVVKEFSGPNFDSLRRKYGSKMYGPPIIIEAAKSTGHMFPLSKSGYPLYCRLLNHCKVSITGVVSKEELLDLRRKILYMDGSFLEKEAGLTHLVAARCRGVKYRDAVALGKPILKPDWINYIWDQRDNPCFEISLDQDQFKVRAFHACKIYLDGFSEEEKEKMKKIVEENGGKIVPTVSDDTTHMVKGKDSTVNVCNISVPSNGPLTPPSGRNEPDASEFKTPLKRPRFELPVINDLNDSECATPIPSKESYHEKLKVVKAEWFWTSIQIDACADESAYLIGRKNANEDQNDHYVLTPSSITSPLAFSDPETPTSIVSPSDTRERIFSGRKRKRGRDFFSSLAPSDFPRIPEIEDENGVLNLGGRSLNPSEANISDVEFGSILKQISCLLSNISPKYSSMTKRHIEFIQLLETERNYVSVLMNIVKNFKEPCEKEDQAGGRILDTQEIKMIFDPILPIYAVHRQILRDLYYLAAEWNEEKLIGEIHVKYAERLRKAYEPYVNFFEKSKNEILRCEAEKPRFMAFLKIAQGKPECGKEKLSELMIRPVQRLPSTALILKNLMKHTSETNPDAEWIRKASEKVNEVNQTINAEKKLNDARVALFDTYNEIENCPVELISEHRSLICRQEVTLLSDNYGQRNELFILCVFSDRLLISKKKSCGPGKSLSSAASTMNLRSPSISRKSFAPASSSKPLKFVDWICFSDVRRVLSVIDDNPKCFALVVRKNTEMRERIFTFLDPVQASWKTKEEPDSTVFFAKQIARAADRVDYDHLIVRVDSSTLGIGIGESTSAFAKCARKLSKSRVGRALSLSKTPNKLKRTMSQMMSPFSNPKH